ncbi:MAG: VCBS repeat-containing protein [Oligoflexia bacterium]|nr:VCBS repeat-containing protein [Oligoflexia bacterium]
MNNHVSLILISIFSLFSLFSLFLLPDVNTLVYANEKSNEAFYGFSEKAIYWQTPSREDGWPQDISYQLQADAYTYLRYEIFDINGDGLPDRLAVPSENASKVDYWWVYLNTGNGFTNDKIKWNAPRVKNEDFQVIRANYNASAAYGTFYDLIDMDGDGKADRVAYKDWVAGGDTLLVYLNTGSGFAQTPISWASPLIDFGWMQFPTNKVNQNVYRTIIDMNKDRKPDRVEVGNSTFKGEEFRVSLNTGSSFSLVPISWYTPEVPMNSWDQIITDVQSQNGVVRQTIIDMNGDGLPDRVTASANLRGNLLVYLNNGNGFDSVPLDWNNPVEDSNTNQGVINFDNNGNITELIDMNGDGLPDKVSAVSTNSRGNKFLKVYLNNGEGFNKTAIYWSTPVVNKDWYQYPTLTSSTGIYATIIDMNGDGRPDRVTAEAHRPTGKGWLKVYLNMAPKPTKNMKIKK